MIGRGAAVAEVGAHRHELHGVIAFSAWLGVHASLMTGVRNRIDAFISWGWDYFSQVARAAGPRPLDAARIDWDEDRAPEPLTASLGTPRSRSRPSTSAARSSRPRRSTTSCSSRSRSGRRGSSRSCRRAWRRTGIDAWLRSDPLLRDAAGDQLRHRRRDRPRAGVPVRDALVLLLARSSATSSAPARHRRPRRLLPRGDLPRPLDLRLGQAAPRSTWPRSGSLAVGHVALGVLHPRSELVDAAPGRLPDRRRGEAQLTNVSALLTSKRVRAGRVVHVLLAFDGLRLDRRARRRLPAVCAGRETDAFRRAATLALDRRRSRDAVQLALGNRFGEMVTSAQVR